MFLFMFAGAAITPYCHIGSAIPTLAATIRRKTPFLKSFFTGTVFVI